MLAARFSDLYSVLDGAIGSFFPNIYLKERNNYIFTHKVIFISNMINPHDLEFKIDFRNRDFAMFYYYNILVNLFIGYNIFELNTLTRISWQ